MEGNNYTLIVELLERIGNSTARDKNIDYLSELCDDLCDIKNSGEYNKLSDVIVSLKEHIEAERISINAELESIENKVTSIEKMLG